MVRATNAASSCSESATYPTIWAPSPPADHRFFGRREVFLAMTALAARRIVCVER